MAFLSDSFLLQTATARELYTQFAQKLPLVDYHTHLSPADIETNRRFGTLFDIWLEGDHYKWRAMRANGISERFCTGNADAFSKFEAWASTVPACLRNPLYHWTHLELRRYFQINDLLSPATAKHVWAVANQRLRDDDLTTQGILKTFEVEVVCTTDDPADSLTAHTLLLGKNIPTRVLPTFRPDRALQVNEPAKFNGWVDRLAAAADVHISTLSDFLDALARRHEAFHEIGGRLSDHGLETCFEKPCGRSKATAIFARARAGRAASDADYRSFAAFLMVFFAELAQARGWTQQLHIGARRNANSRAYATLGPDTGHDCMGDWQQVPALSAYLDRLDRNNALPNTVIYNHNPADNYAVATLAGSFQDGSSPGRIQFGSGWWFLDQKEGIEWQLNALSNTGLLSHFIGMTTDSRSFMSFPRHEYFRRILCNLVGAEIERGELPDHADLVGPLISNVCYGNARRHLGLAS